ncbi:single-stranded DNA-binding protein [Cellulomonas sp. RIT-PI-Y]|uniref:single-stranded DNA-binding protein n=1 Tax=Cellulomonas sp. RIT-PI-Y TaxID=3035297 RepID=UPI0021D88679|nr:single-stranded DNA-binding protein [Cellulomonas sp. RIT-PI-Y]
MSAITVVGNVVAAPEMGVTPSGRRFVRLTVAENQGHRDRNSGEWVEDDATFWPVTLWGDSTENVIQSNIVKGTRVIVLGRTRTANWETPEGDKRSRVEVTASEIAASTRSAQLRIAKVLRSEPGDSPASASVAAHAAPASPDAPPF